MGKAARIEMEKYDWRAATRTIRNENYNDVIWFWKITVDTFHKGKLLVTLQSSLMKCVNINFLASGARKKLNYW
ncbi:hypothetical protein MtrunA17_Chr4g0005961 [Medicago truncatula]|uniref:Uncharacterized protein n=1 Tax=Medicago truncatula TaxID=3880 RepID=G7JN00_MEDTR|nr:hypothetical protein MTR_4g015250 [Medicago truncatula]RHN58771.1 hypothetical protein MtrunA17_Chr4g0005961 [Medicago truncatula]